MAIGDYTNTEVKDLIAPTDEGTEAEFREGMDALIDQASDTGDRTELVTPEALSLLGDITATAAQINNVLEDTSFTTNDLNKADGLLSTTAELNVLDGYTGSGDDLNALASDVTATELGYLEAPADNTLAEVPLRFYIPPLETAPNRDSRSFIFNESGDYYMNDYHDDLGRLNLILVVSGDVNVYLNIPRPGEFNLVTAPAFLCIETSGATGTIHWNVAGTERSRGLNHNAAHIYLDYEARYVSVEL